MTDPRDVSGVKGRSLGEPGPRVLPAGPVVPTYETVGVAVGAYPGGRPRTSLTHTLRRVGGSWDRVLCTRVQEDGIVLIDDAGAHEAPTCPVCRRRDPRVPGAAEPKTAGPGSASPSALDDAPSGSEHDESLELSAGALVRTGCAKCDAAAKVLSFCAGAVEDAIGLEDGLDGAAGTAVLAMIREWQERGTFDVPRPAFGATVRSSPTAARGGGTEVEAAQRAMDEFYQWSEGLDCAGHSSAQDFEDHYLKLSKAKEQGEEAFVAAARAAVAATLRRLHPTDHGRWLPLAEALASSPTAARGVTGLEARLAEIEERANAATEGPWHVGSCMPESFYTGAESVVAEGRRVLLTLNSNFPAQRDSAFIAHARQDIPWLVATLRTLLSAADGAW